MRASVPQIARLALVCLIGTLESFAQTSSPELERLQAEVAPYQLPVALGTKIIPSISFKETTMEQFAKAMQAHGVEIAIAKSLQDVRLNIALRNLSLNRVLQFVTQQINAQWIYRDDRIVLFRSKDELNPSYQQVFEEKHRLDQQIRTEQHRLRSIENKQLKKEFQDALLTEVSIQNATLTEILKQLIQATSKEGLGKDGKGINIIPVFDPKAYSNTHSYTFRNRSLRHILDTICEDSKMEWRANNGYIAVSPRR